MKYVFWFQYSILFKQEHGELHQELFHSMLFKIFFKGPTFWKDQMWRHFSVSVFFNGAPQKVEQSFLPGHVAGFTTGLPRVQDNYYFPMRDNDEETLCRSDCLKLHWRVSCVWCDLSFHSLCVVSLLSPRWRHLDGSVGQEWSRRIRNHRHWFTGRHGQSLEMASDHILWQPF